MHPRSCLQFLAGLGRSATSLGFWENVYGFDMSTVGQEVFADAGEMPIVDEVHPGDVVTEPCLIQVTPV
jgi:protein arginine N-methyltransferase 3